jgi:hypothetical protein
MSESMVPSPLMRDVGQWSARARIWRLTTARQGELYEAISCGTRLEELEAVTAKRASRFTSESTMTFFCLPETLKAEAASLDPASLLSPEKEGQSRRFIEHFAEYLEFLGLSPQLQARACIVAPSEVSRAIVRPFAEPEAAEGDTVVCCNLSEIEAHVAIPWAPPPAAGGPEAAEAISVALDTGDCLIGTRRSMLGYLPDQHGEPTFWFECLVRK